MTELITEDAYDLNPVVFYHRNGYRLILVQSGIDGKNTDDTAPSGEKAAISGGE